MTIPTQLVLQALLEVPETERYGFEIAEACGLRSGTVHPILARLESTGWVQSRWEDIDPRTARRPARRYYQLSAEGRPRASHALSRSKSATRHLGPLRLAGEPR
jgi:PadR family transcriptional regulator, regulatory protein PadR